MNDSTSGGKDPNLPSVRAGYASIFKAHFLTGVEPKPEAVLPGEQRHKHRTSDNGTLQHCFFAFAAL